VDDNKARLDILNKMLSNEVTKLQAKLSRLEQLQESAQALGEKLTHASEMRQRLLTYGDESSELIRSFDATVGSLTGEVEKLEQMSWDLLTGKNVSAPQSVPIQLVEEQNQSPEPATAKPKTSGQAKGFSPNMREVFNKVFAFEPLPQNLTELMEKGYGSGWQDKVITTVGGPGKTQRVTLGEEIDRENSQTRKKLTGSLRVLMSYRGHDGVIPAMVAHTFQLMEQFSDQEIEQFAKDCRIYWNE